MSGPTASEKMGLGPECRELKFGDSFSNKGTSFHTIRYDFKPASVDTSKMATLDVQNGQVTISMPNSDGNGVNIFSGPRKPHGKECVLIIDPETGECVLEKLYHSIQVKKTRQDGSSRQSKAAQAIIEPKGMLSAAPSVPEVKKHHMGQSSSSLSSSHHRMDIKSSASPFESKQTKHRPPTSSSNSNKHRKPPSPVHRHSPLNPSPDHRLSPPGLGSNAFDALLSNHKQQQQLQSSSQQQQSSLLSASAMPSLTNFDDLLAAGPSPTSFPPPPPPASTVIAPASARPSSSHPPPASLAPKKPPPPPPPPPAVVASPTLSDSSSSSSSSVSSSDASDDSSDEDMEEIPIRDIIPPSMPSIPSMPSLPTISSFSSNVLSQKSSSSNPHHHHHPSAASSRPAYSLSDDLQLSESGSDDSD